MNDLIKEKYDLAPSDPGVYLMKDLKGKVIYVGKAKNLKKRLSSYFVKSSGHDPKTTMLVRNIEDFETIVASTEYEALILEATLIKKYKPKYNIFLKDGKNYPCFRIDTMQSYPVLQVVRKIKNDGATYFGPYASGYNVKKTLKQVNRIFKLRKCKDTQFRNRTRPCIQFQINACLGPCCYDVPAEEYRRIVSDVILFLKGKAPDLIKRFRIEMAEEAGKEHFEKAAQIRDTIFAIEQTLEQQIAVSSDMMDRDVIACTGDQGTAVVTLLFVRSGYVVGTQHFSFEMNWNDTSQIMEAFMKQYYQRSTYIPRQILVSENFEDRSLLEESLSKENGKKVSILVPERGEKRLIVEMAINNSKKELSITISRSSENEETLLMLQRLLGMENRPSRIECFDNSNLSGTDPVSSMVVFMDGEAAKSRYRKFIIKNVTGQDDYAYMTEVLSRRFNPRKRVDVKNVIERSGDENIVDQDLSDGNGAGMELPDLLVVDGGRGQLSMAVSVLRELGLSESVRVVGLAKKDEMRGEVHDKIYVPGRINPLNTTQSLKALYLLQRLRDEAHRFAITFQKKRRSMRAETSILDGIPGIGKKRKTMLLTRFKGLSAMRKASAEDIAALPGMTMRTAEAVLEAIKLEAIKKVQ